MSPRARGGYESSDRPVSDLRPPVPWAAFPSLAACDPGGYAKRAVDVYQRGAPACGRQGPQNATCLLEPDHDGAHEGNGYDQFGPLYHQWDPS